jgi:MoaA/NifB/PqqE/SkfB family radical SAM enzyme
VQLSLDTPGGPLVVRIETREPGRRAFALTRSFALSYLGEPPHAAIDTLVSFARQLAAVDPGGLALKREPKLRRRLGVLGEDPGGSWSRDTFDRSIASLTSEGQRFDHAVLVVTQACELACQFCPSKDAAHEVVATSDVDGQLEDLVHQLAAGRRLGARSVDIGGNDVLQFPRAIELFERAGELGYETVAAQSPGQSMADAAFARALSKTPLTLVEVPIYGATAEVHDRVTGTPGSFDRLCEAIDRVRELVRPTIGLRTLALRSTLGLLEELLAFTEVRFGLELTVRQLFPNRVGEREHLVDAVSFAELAPIVARHPTRFEPDVPLCIFPEDQRSTPIQFLRRRRSLLHLWDQGIVPGSEDDRAKRDRQRVLATDCQRCTLRTDCSGILRAHFELLGTEGITPVGAEEEGG